jgi:hypothetical protein
VAIHGMMGSVRRIGGAVATMAMVLLGCRTVDPTPRPTEPLAPQRPDTARRATGELGPAGEVAVARPVVPPQAVVPIELPFPSQALVIRPVVDRSPVVLFPDEADAVRRRVAMTLVAHGYEVVPVEELERIEAAAAAGRLVLEGDQACRVPLLPNEIVARYFSGRPFAEVEADCPYAPCRLQVTLRDSEQPDFYRGYASRVSRPHDPKAWVGAAAKLRVATKRFGSIGLGMIGSSHSPPVRFEFPRGIGPWGKSPIDAVMLAAAQQPAAGCAHPDVVLGFRTTLRVSVDARGNLSRCEATSEHTMARPADGACLCQALELLDLPRGSPGRRFRVVAVDEGGFRGSGLAFELVQPGTEPWLHRIDESPALTRCTSPELPRTLDALVTLALAPDGSVTDVRIDGDITTPPAIALAQCLVKELRLVPLPCRPPGVDALQVRLVAKL